MNTPFIPGGAQCSNRMRHWYASLQLIFGDNAGRTELVHCDHRGPLRVQRLFHPEENGKAHCYLLHPPGGVAMGDELEIDVSLRSGSAVVTTPSAGRFYTVDGQPQPQRQRVHLRAADGQLAWLPQETILFSGADARLDTQITIEERTHLVYWDVLVLGRPACGEGFSTGRVEQHLDISRDGTPLLRERLALDAGDRFTRSRIGLGGASTIGLMAFTCRGSADWLETWLRRVNGGLEGRFTATRRDGLCIARYLGDDAAKCRAGYASLWAMQEQARSGSTPQAPRIWHT